MTTMRQDPPVDPDLPAGRGGQGESDLTARAQFTAEPPIPLDAAAAAAWRRQLRQVLEAAGAHEPAAAEPTPTPSEPAPGFARTQQDGIDAILRLTASPLARPEPNPPELTSAASSTAASVPLTEEAVTPDDADADGQPEPRSHRENFAHLPRLLCLAAVLAMQAALAVPLITSRTAFNDEALYLWAGRVEWSHWLHGTHVPAFQTYFSGSPVIYPPLGALANAVGGLDGARVLSLLFMMGATVLLWGTASRLFDWKVAAFATGLWAALGPTQHLGAYATYDAMALFLIALAAWCATGRRDREDATGWMLAAAGALALANATKYASAIFDPVVIALAVTSAWPEPGGKIAVRRGTFLTACAAGLIALLLRLGGGEYLQGIDQTTITRTGDADSVMTVLGQSWGWIGLIVVIAAAGVVLSWRRPQRLTVALLTLAALLVPAEQARIHTTTSLNKHVDFGAWFAAMAAGYALSRLVTLIRPRLGRAAAAVVVAAGVLAAATIGTTQARAMLYGYWGNEARLIAKLRPLTSHGGQFLAEGQYVPVYYMPDSRWQNWSNTRSIHIPHGSTISVPVGGIGSPYDYKMLISTHFFRVVLLTDTDTVSLDQVITRELATTPGWHVAARIPFGPTRNGYYTIWAWRPQT